MSESNRDGSSSHATSPAPVDQVVTREHVSAYLAFLAEEYPVLLDVLDRVADELIAEGVDLQAVRDGDLSPLGPQLRRIDSPSPHPE